MKIIILFSFFLLSCQHKFFEKKEESIKILPMTQNEEVYLKKLEETKCSKELVHELINPINQINLNSISSKSYEFTFLHVATMYCSDSLFLEILTQTQNFDYSSVFSKTPLTLAIEQNSLFKVKSLINKGANINHQEFLGNPVFFIILKNKNKDLLNIFISHNFNPFVLGFMESSWKDVFKNHEFKLIIESHEKKYLQDNNLIKKKNKNLLNFF